MSTPSLAACLALLGVASAALATPTRPLPGRTPPQVQSSAVNPYASTDPRLNAVRPVLELMITVRQVADPILELTDAQLASVLASLNTIRIAKTLSVREADMLSAQLLSVLTSTQRQRLDASREARSTQLRSFMTRARFASSGDGPPQIARWAYSQWLGTAPVDTLLAHHDPATVKQVVDQLAHQAVRALIHEP